MAKLPTVAIIGRPNTGKSTLFNRMIGKRRAIVSDVPGTTRDHVSERIDEESVSYLLVDTGGMGATYDTDFEEDVFEQSMLALEHADVILLTINGKEDLTEDDHNIIDVLRKKRKRHVPVLVVLTKVDNEDIAESTAPQPHEVRIGDDVLHVSATHNRGVDELRERIVQELKRMHFGPLEERTDGVLRIAIVGKPNVGKSSLVNALMSDMQREQSALLVSEVAGTTRDSTDTLVHFNERPYMLVDTAGIKKHTQSLEQIERYAMLRTVQALESADIGVLVLDATQPVSQQDKKIASLIAQSGKGMVILANKMDTLKGEERKEKLADIALMLNFCRYAKILPCSAKTRDGVVKLFDVAEAVQAARQRRIPMRELTKWFERVTYGQPLGEIARSKYITQAEDIPPTFVIFVKNPKKVGVSQLRYLENRLRETFGFDGTPIRWITKSSQREPPAFLRNNA
jgi:GTP-binding protein